MNLDAIQERRKAPVTFLLIVINVLCFVWVETHGSSLDADNMVRWGASYAPLIFERKEYWRLLSAAFLHFGIRHIANNMLVLFVLGDNLERALGHMKYLLFYLLCAVGSNLFSLYMNMDAIQRTVGAGASGAVYGVIGGLLWALIRNRGRLEDLSTGRVFSFVILSLYYSFTDQGIDNYAHIGGLLVGFLLSMLLYRKPDEKEEYLLERT